jgi:outer membrane protein assembly factor BamB
VSHHRPSRIPPILLLSIFLAATAAGQKATRDTNWPAFRGQNAAGVAEGFPLPVDWDVATSRNVLWKTEIPGLGNSSPIVWGDHLFVSTAVSGVGKPEFKPGLYGDVASVNDNTTHRWIVYCLDKRTGKIVWEKTVHTGVPKIKRHPKSTHASSTLATDGRHLVAFFGSEGLHCFDMTGKPLWKRDLGVLESAWYVAPEAQWEFGSSPVIFQDMVLIQVDVLKGSFLAALNVNDGADIWRTPREDVPTWGTPAVYTGGARPQVVVNGYKHIGGYELKTGKPLWRMTGGGDIPVPTPVVAGDLALITNAHGKLAPIYAIRLSASGDISLEADKTANEFVAWSYPRDGSYMGSPVVYGDIVFNCRWNGVRTAVGQEAVPGAARERNDRVHGVCRSRRREDLHRERGRRRLRPQGGAGFPGDREELDGRGLPGEPGHLRRRHLHPHGITDCRGG